MMPTRLTAVKKMTAYSRLLLAIAILSIAAIPFLARPVAADTNTGTAGQPSQSCQNFFPVNGLQPSGFNTNGFNNTATSVYAGSGQTLNTPANGAAVSQYDVACFQVSQHQTHPQQPTLFSDHLFNRS